MYCSTPGFPILHSLGVFSNSCPLSRWCHSATDDEVMCNHLKLCRQLLLLPLNVPSIRVFSNESALLIMWSWYCSFSISSYNKYSGLISFRIDWFELLAAKELSGVISSTTVRKHQFFSTVSFMLYGLTLTSIHDYWKNSSFDYMDLCQQSDISLFNTLSKFVIVYLPRNKHLLISWLQSPSIVI